MSSQTHKVDAESRRSVSGGSLTADIGIDEEEIEWRKEFTGFDGRDAARLEANSDTFERIADDLVEEFYDHLQSYSETVAVLDSSSKPIEALKRTQREYLLDLGRGEYGREYFDRRARVGKIHDMLDLGPKSYLGAYAVYYDGIAEGIAQDVKSEFDDDAVGEAVDTALGRLCSALKLMNLDQQVAMDTYIHSYNERVEAQLEKRSTLQREVRKEVQAPIDDLQEGTDRVVGTAEEMATLADRSAASAEDVADEIENLSAAVEEVAARTDDVATESERADELATEGRRSASEAIGTMENVTTAADEVTDDVERLRDRLSEIDDVVDVIDDIAEQTNILALNASIEAARAETGGEGFAVVADEVKSLAEESRTQASRIDEMVSEIQADAGKTVSSLEAATDSIDESTEEVTAVLERLEEIAAAVGDATDGIEEVSRATDEQAASAEEIASMVGELTEQSEALTEAIADVAETNREQREEIEEIAGAVDRLTGSMDDIE